MRTIPTILKECMGPQASVRSGLRPSLPSAWGAMKLPGDPPSMFCTFSFDVKLEDVNNKTGYENRRVDIRFFRRVWDSSLSPSKAFPLTSLNGKTQSQRVIDESTVVRPMRELILIVLKYLVTNSRPGLSGLIFQ